MKKKEKQRICLILSLMLILSLLLGGGIFAEDKELKKEIVIADSDEWWGLDTTQLDGASFTQSLIADPLILLDMDGKPIPSIASEVEFLDGGKTLRLRIEEGMKYTDGRDLTPEDVVASLERAKTSGPFGVDLGPIESMEIKGRDVFLYLSEYTCNISNTLSGAFVTIMPEEDTKLSNDDLLWGCQPYGMYSLEDYVAGSHVILKRNPHYKSFNPEAKNQGPVPIEKIKLRFIKEEFSRVNAFNVGDVQVAMGMSVDGLSQITIADYNLQNEISIPNIHYIEVNQADPILEDIRVRQAIALAIDRDDLVEANKDAVVKTYAIVSEEVLNFSQKFYDDYKAGQSDDLEKAKKLLDEAGWKDSDKDGIRDKDGQALKLQLLGCAQPTDERSAQAIQLQLKEIGIQIEIELIESNYRYEKIEAGEFQLGIEQFGAADPVLLLSWLFTNPDNLKEKDAYFETITKASHTLDYGERTELFDKAQRLVSDEAVIIPLYSVKELSLWSKDIEKPGRLPFGFIIWNDLG